MTPRTDADIAAIVSAVEAYHRTGDSQALRDALEVEEEATLADEAGVATWDLAGRCECCGRTIHGGSSYVYWAGYVLAHAGPCVADDREVSLRFSNGLRRNVPARVIGKWAMHKIVTFYAQSNTQWAVSHVPSGIAIPSPLTRAEAWAITKALGETVTDETLCADALPRVRSIVEATLGRPLRADSASVGVRG